MKTAVSLVRFAVVALWVVLVAMLLRPQPAPEAPNQAGDPPAPATENAVESWMGVYMKEHKIGYTSSRFLPVAGGHRFEQRSVLRLTVMDTVQVVHADIDGETGPDFALRSFRASIRSGVGDLEARGVVEGRELVVTLRTGSAENAQRFPLDEPIFLPAAARHTLRGAALAPGTEVTRSIFDPTTMRHEPMRATVEGRERIKTRGGEVDAWKIREELHGMQTMVWIDDAGTELREEGPMNLVAVRETASEAMSRGWREDAAFDVMAAVKVPLQGTVTAPRRTKRLELIVRGAGGLVVPDDQRQRRDGERVVVTREDPGAAGTYPLPYADAQWRSELAPTAFLQADHPRVREAAVTAMGGETDAARAAVALRRWVNAYVEKVPVASVPNALQVLDMRRGDCNEHAALYAALARAAGLPARVVGGVVYSDGAFLYHAWNEVWLGNGWVTVDATFDQMPADATHLKLVDDGMNVDGLMRVIGRLSVEIVAES